ncbi:MAG TPA: tyrosine--tRNA ligase [Clostridia bacterium]|nr:tyrosine--tRNA ligase [Clostridia bacterium]
MDAQELFDIVKRDAVTICQEDMLKEKLLSGKKLKIKFGADPSRPDLHLGHSVVLRKLRLFQQLGHEIIFVIGDFTGMIGDPTGASKTRAQLTFEQTRENGRSYFEQVSKILDPQKAVVAYNSEWLGTLSFAEVLGLASKYTLARVLERDDFARRYAENRPIGLHELFYPLMQGYDSVALEADVEVGGTDQTFNLLVGRALQKDYGQTPQEVVTFPLLPGLDGTEKMSKSLGNTIGISEAPETMFEKCMKVPDHLLPDYFRLTTDLAQREFEGLIAGDIRAAHFAYAREIVRLYCGEEAVAPAERRYREVASGAPPENIEAIAYPEKSAPIVSLVRAAGFAASNGEARRLVEGGGIKIDGATVRDAAFVVAGRGEVILQRGKNRFARVTLG